MQCYKVSPALAEAIANEVVTVKIFGRWQVICPYDDDDPYGKSWWLDFDSGHEAHYFAEKLRQHIVAVLTNL